MSTHPAISKDLGRRTQASEFIQLQGQAGTRIHSIHIAWLARAFQLPVVLPIFNGLKLPPLTPNPWRSTNKLGLPQAIPSPKPVDDPFYSEVNWTLSRSSMRGNGLASFGQQHIGDRTDLMVRRPFDRGCFGPGTWNGRTRPTKSCHGLR